MTWTIESDRAGSKGRARPLKQTTEHPRVGVVDDPAIFAHLVSFLACLQVVDVGRAETSASELAGDPRPGLDAFAATGFLLHFKGFLFWVTAGHVLDAIKERRNAGRRAIRCRLLDKAAADGKFGGLGISFELAETAMFWADREDMGLDCGAILIPAHQARLLAAGGANVIRWSHLAKFDRQFDAYAMLGFPKMARRITHKRTPGGGYVHFSVATPLLPLTPVVPPQSLIKAYPRRFFRVIPHTTDLRGQKVTVHDLHGMSGGPVFGFRNQGKCGSIAELIGIQSTQSESGIACVCSLRPFLRAIGAKLDKQLATRHAA